MANSFWQREKRMKRMNSTSFQGLEKPENFGKLLAKGRRRRRSSKRLRNQCGKLACVKNELEKID